jgi:hypothetical protein
VAVSALYIEGYLCALMNTLIDCRQWAGNEKRAKMIDHDRPKYPPRKHGTCCACGWYARLNLIYASQAPDVARWLCDACKARRQAALEAMWREE